ncbi:dna repair metallo-beta-lactamase, partial [Lasius niger]
MAADGYELETDDDVPLSARQDLTLTAFDDEPGELLLGLDGLDDLDGFEGEEMREMRFMREQARLEAEEAGSVPGEDSIDDAADDNAMTESCPICNGCLAGISVDDATRHVNSCLDGSPVPIPAQAKDPPNETPKVESADLSKRFARAAIPRPAQPNPLELERNGKDIQSAFSKLMTNNAEDSAWATAAAAEHASRGRPAYE